MVAFFKRHIADWMDGTESLSDGAYRAYDVICNLIYLNEGPITNNERGIAGRCNQRLDRYRHHLAELIAAGKLSLDDEGKLHNARSSRELGAISTNRLNASKGGSAKRRGRSAQARETVEDGHEQVSASKPLKINGAGEAPLPNEGSLKDKTRQEKTREENKGAGAPSSPREILLTVLDEEHAAAVLQHRVKKRSALTPHTAKLLANQLSQCPDPNAAADEMMLRGWTGVKPAWLKDTPGTGPPPPRETRTRQAIRKFLDE